MASKKSLVRVQRLTIKEGFARKKKKVEAFGFHNGSALNDGESQGSGTSRLRHSADAALPPGKRVSPTAEKRRMLDGVEVHSKKKLRFEEEKASHLDSTKDPPPPRKMSTMTGKPYSTRCSDAEKKQKLLKQRIRDSDQAFKRSIRERDREKLRTALKEMEEKVEVEDNLEYMGELQRLCGWSPFQFQNARVVENFGLFLKKDEEDLRDQMAEERILRMPSLRIVKAKEKMKTLIPKFEPEIPACKAERIAMMRSRYAEIISKAQKYKQSRQTRWSLGNETNKRMIVA